MVMRVCVDSNVTARVLVIAARSYDGDGARELISLLPKDSRYILC